MIPISAARSERSSSYSAQQLLEMFPFVSEAQIEEALASHNTVEEALAHLQTLADELEAEFGRRR